MLDPVSFLTDPVTDALNTIGNQLHEDGLREEYGLVHQVTPIIDVNQVVRHTPTPDYFHDPSSTELMIGVKI